MNPSPLDCLADLHSPDKSVRNAATQTLAALGDAAVPLIVPLLDEDSWVLRYRACEVLGLIKNPENNFHLIRKLTDEKDHVRYMAVKGLGLSGDVSVVREIIPMLKDENNFVRRVSVIMLGEFSTDEGIVALQECDKVETDPVVKASLEKVLFVR